MIAAYIEGLVESILIASTFYFVYMIFFSTEGSFARNRFLLLAGIVLSLVLPFVEFSGPQDINFQAFVELKTIEVFSSGSKADVNLHFFSWTGIFCAIYIIGGFFFLTEFVRQIIKISGFYRNSNILVENSVKYVYTGKKHPVFSFLNMIFIDFESENSPGLDAIIKHERVHVAQKHSIDLLLFELLAIVQWFNPIIWLYRKTIKHNHEFLADNGVLKNGFSVDNYQELLLHNYSAFNLGLANSFNHSLTFKRLIMMKKNSSNRKSLVKFLAIIPILLVSVYFISCSKNDPVTDNTNESKEKVGVVDESGNEVVVMADKLAKDPSETVFDAAEVMPEFPGGDLGLRKFIAINVKYPKEARENGIEGKVYVQFVVNKTGKVVESKIVRSVDPILDAEAIRVINLLPDWKPAENKGEKVSVHFTVPISFKLQ